MRILGLPGSLRQGSFNRLLLEAAAAHAPAGMTVSVAPWDLLASVPPFDEDVEAACGGDPESVGRLRDAVREADGVLISTPEYNQSIPGVLKNHLDWLSRARPDEVLAGKPVAVMGATTGAWGTRLAQSMTRQVLGSVEALVLPPGVSIYIRKADRLFDTGKLRDPDTVERLQRFLDSFQNWIIRVRPAAARAQPGTG